MPNAIRNKATAAATAITAKAPFVIAALRPRGSKKTGRRSVLMTGEPLEDLVTAVALAPVNTRGAGVGRLPTTARYA